MGSGNSSNKNDILNKPSDLDILADLCGKSTSKTGLTENIHRKMIDDLNREIDHNNGQFVSETTSIHFHFGADDLSDHEQPKRQCADGCNAETSLPELFALIRSKVEETLNAKHISFSDSIGPHYPADSINSIKSTESAEISNMNPSSNSIPPFNLKNLEISPQKVRARRPIKPHKEFSREEQHGGADSDSSSVEVPTVNTDSDDSSSSTDSDGSSSSDDSEEGVILSNSSIGTTELYQLQKRIYDDSESEGGYADSDSESYTQKVSKAIADRNLQKKIFSSESRHILGLMSDTDEIRPSNNKNPKYII